MQLDLPLAYFRIDLRAIAPIVFRHYSGSAWRGLFGHALREVACVTHSDDCAACLLRHRCAYSYLFETPPPADALYMRRATAAPHPFVLRPGLGLQRVEPGDVFSLGLILAGRGVDYLPYVVHALQHGGDRGIGASDGQYRLVAVQMEDPPGSGRWRHVHDGERLQPVQGQRVPVPEPPERAVIAIESPLRLRHRQHVLSPASFRLSGMVAALLRRYSMISYFHGNGPFETDFKRLIEAADRVRYECADLRWFDWQRYSSRQDRKIRMGGLVGQVEYRGESLRPFWPLLWIGQWLHLGKGTSMGMGEYRIDSARPTE